MSGVGAERKGSKMRMKQGILLLAAVLLAAGVQAGYVTIGNAGNDDDTTGYGGVSYEYNILDHEVTIAEMQASGVGTGIENYWNTGGRTEGTNAPATLMHLDIAKKYSNWLTSGSATDGVYQFNGVGGAYSETDRAAAITTYGTVYALPTEDEWYKAAYYTGSAYSKYVNGTAVAPVDVLTANQTGWNYNGAGTAVINPWVAGGSAVEQNGTHDMGGNVWEFLEDDAGVVRGGSYGNYDIHMANTYRGAWGTGGTASKGFRVVEVVPAPMTISLLVVAGAGMMLIRRITMR